MVSVVCVYHHFQQFISYCVRKDRIVITDCPVKLQEMGKYLEITLEMFGIETQSLVSDI